MNEINQYYTEAYLSKIAYNQDEDNPLKITDVITIPETVGNAEKKYEIIDLIDNPSTGYAGYVFREVINDEPAGDIIIAHRGTDDDGNADGLNNDKDYLANRYIGLDFKG